jgi:PTS system nitrogen regulatory IIA component
MNDLSDLVAPDAILPRLSANSRRQALQALAEALAKSAGIEPRVAFEAVLMRERLSGTGMGEGVAIPHAQISGLLKPIGAFARLEPSQNFDAMDGRPADLVFMLLTPAEKGGDHLKALARVSRFLRRADMRDRLRAARGAVELRALFASPPTKSDAA